MSRVTRVIGIMTGSQDYSRHCCRRLTLSVLVASATAAIALSPAAFHTPSSTARAQELFDKTNRQADIEMGREGARALEASVPLSRSRAMQERVRRVGEALVAAMPDKAYSYEFKVLADPEFNATCLPGGFMYVNEGLLNRLSGDDDALAYVMGHEITHAAHRHWANKVSKASRNIVIGTIFDIFTRGNSGRNAAVMERFSYSRETEADADRGGLELMWAAGFDPDKAYAAPRIMAEMEAGHEIPAYLRTHPHPADRLRDMQSLAAKLKERPRPPLPRRGGTEPSTPEVSGAALAKRLVGTIPTDVTSAENPWYPVGVGAEWTYELSSSGASSAPTRYTVRIAGKLTAQATAAPTEAATGAAVGQGAASPTVSVTSGGTTPADGSVSPTGSTAQTGATAEQATPKPDQSQQEKPEGITVFRAVTVLSGAAAAEIPFQLFTTADAVWRRNRPTANESPWKAEHVIPAEEGKTEERDGTSYIRLPAESVSTPCGVYNDVAHGSPFAFLDTCAIPARGIIESKKAIRCPIPLCRSALVALSLPPSRLR